MKRLVSRIAAFILDLCVAMLIIVGLSSIPLLNPKIKEIDTYYIALNGEYSKYENIKTELEIILKDSIINDSEYDNIKTNYNSYLDIFKDIKLNEKLDSKVVSEFEKKVNEKYQEIENDYAYKINKLSISESIISIVVYILYFGVIPYIFNGQTLFKKIFKLRVVDSNDITIKIPLWKYLVRAFLICELVFNVGDLIFLFILPKESYIMVNFWANELKYLYEIIFLITFVIRDDQRSIHDLLLNTLVIKYDKDGNIVEEPIFKEEFPLDDKNAEKNLKKKKGKKEEVKAIKINDK